MIPPDPSPHDSPHPAEIQAEIQAAVQVLERGGVVGYPSGTVWGLAALPTSRAAVERLYAVKGRDAGKPVQLSVESAAAAAAWVALPQPGYERAARLWPRPLTLLAWAAPGCPAWLAPPETPGGPGVVGLRVPDSPAALALLRACGGALATTSLNPSGQAAATTRAEAERYALADLLIGEDPPDTGGLASTVLDTRSGAVLRGGAVSREELERLLGTARD